MTTVHELACLAENTRRAQADYFRTRTVEALRIARDWERRLDEAAAAVLRPPQAGLFDATTTAPKE